jgi:hypothetical protein
LNRRNATTSMAQGFLVHRQPPHAVACCGLETTKNPHGIGVVAVWRIDPPNGEDCDIDMPVGPTPVVAKKIRIREPR